MSDEKEKDEKDNLGEPSIDTDGDLGIGLGNGLSIDTDGDVGISLGGGLSIDTGGDVGFSI